MATEPTLTHLEFDQSFITLRLSEMMAGDIDDPESPLAGQSVFNSESTAKITADIPAGEYFIACSIQNKPKTNEPHLILSLKNDREKIIDQMAIPHAPIFSMMDESIAMQEKSTITPPETTDDMSKEEQEQEIGRFLIEGQNELDAINRTGKERFDALKEHLSQWVIFDDITTGQLQHAVTVNMHMQLMHLTPATSYEPPTGGIH